MPWSIFTDGGGPGAAVTWADDLLKAIGAPRSAGNRQMVYDWEVAEGGGGKFNPLNQGPDPKHPNWSGGTQFGGGAADYTSWSTGLKGARDYLAMPNFSGIRARLRNNDPQGAEQALFNSPWAASHYGGGANFPNTPLPGKKTALKGGGGNGNITTDASVSCPSFLTDPIGWATCQGTKNLTNTSGIGSFFLNPADALERIGLVVFGALLILVGIAILGFGPASRALGIAASTSRETRAVGRVLGGGNNNAGPPDEGVQEERSRRLDIAERNIDLGERKQQFREDRELRLSRKQKHRGSSEPNPNPQHS